MVVGPACETLCMKGMNERQRRLSRVDIEKKKKQQLLHIE